MMTRSPRRWPLLHRLGIYLLAVVSAYILATFAATQSVIANLTEMGVAVSVGTRISMTATDLLGMAGTFLPMVAAGFLIAFLVVGMLLRWFPHWRTPLYIIAGATALVCIHLTLKLAFGITPVAIGRTVGGLLSQGIAGAAGGYIFARFMR